jgi:4'-phosphopantetheinyl transferase EntD
MLSSHPPAPIEAEFFSVLFPYPVGAAAVRLTDHVFPLYPEEERTVAKAVAKRRIEFAAGRHCARLAIAQVGHVAGALPSGEDRMPIWPAGFVGSITHSAGCCAAVAAPSHRFRAVGIDMEPVDAVSDELAPAVLRPDEAARLDRHARPDGADWLTLHFCLKEAAYKVFYPMFRQIIDFQEMRLLIQPEDRTFTATPQVEGLDGAPSFHGKYLVRHGRIHAACW